jgi:hypothetical protein
MGEASDSAVLESSVASDVIDAMTLTALTPGLRTVSVRLGSVPSAGSVRVLVVSDAPVLRSVPVLSAASPKVGSAVTVIGAEWEPAPTDLAIQWFADGVAIPGATGAAYTPKSGDIGRRLSEVLTARGPSGAANPVKVIAVALVGEVIGEPGRPGQPGKPGEPGQSDAATGLDLRTSTIGIRLDQDAKVGQTLSVGSLPTQLGTVTVRWLRGGQPIADADGPLYRLTSQDAGRSIAAELTAIRAGHQPQVVVTDAVAVAKVAGKVSAKLIKSTVKTTKKARVRVTVKSSTKGLTPSGKVTITVKRAGVTKKVTRKVSGKAGASSAAVTVKLPRLGKGKYKVSVAYSGNDQITAAKRTGNLSLRVR